MLFYRNVFAAAFELAPDAAMQAVVEVVENFQMPGNEVEGFTRRSVAIAMAGIYDLRIHHDEVLAPVLRAWDVWDRTDLGPDGEAARERLAAYLAGRRRRRHALRAEARREGRPPPRPRLTD